MTNQNSGLVYKYVLLDGKIKLSVAEVSEDGRKKWFSPSRKSIFTLRNKFFFKNWIFTSRKKSSNKKILCEVDRKSVSTENLYKNTFVIDQKTADTGKNI